MNTKKKLKLYKYLNLALIVACFFAMGKFYMDSEIFAPKDAIFISPMLNSADYMFSSYDIKRINDNKRDSFISFEKLSGSTIGYEYNNAYAKAIYTDADYFYINHLEYLSGSNFPQEYNDEPIVILGNAVAFKLFGSLECIGKFVRINGIFHEVTGIVKQNERFDEDFIWLPYGSAGFGGYDISSIYIRDMEYNKLNTYEKAMAYIEGVGKSPNGYHIADLNQYRENMLIRAVLVLIIIAVIIICISILNIVRLMDYYKDYIRKIVFNIALILIFGTAIMFIVGFMSDTLWISANAFEVSAFIDNMLNINILPPKQYLPYQLEALSSINSYSVAAFVACLLLIGNFIIINGMDDKRTAK